MQEIINTYPIILQILPWVGGAAGGFLLFVLKNRRPLISYRVSHQRIGMTADDDIHGRVEVRFRNEVVHNLYLSVMEIENRSIKDLENLNIKTFRGSDDIAMLTEDSQIKGTMEKVVLTKDYVERIITDAEWEKEVRGRQVADDPGNAKRLLQDTDFRQGQRHYNIPLLNRGQIATITYLIAADPNASPTVYLTCQTIGVRVKEKPYPIAISELWGVGLFQAAIAGIVVGLVVVGITIWQIDTYWIGAVVCFFVGIFANIPGVLIIKAYSWLRKKIIG